MPIKFNPDKHKLGALCKRNHDHEGSGHSLRYISTSCCVECQRERKATPAYLEKKRGWQAMPATREKERKRKATPEYRKRTRELRALPENKERGRKQRDTPEYRERNRLRMATPYNKERRRKLRGTEEYREQNRKRQATPENREKRRIRDALRVNRLRRFARSRTARHLKWQ